MVVGRQGSRAIEGTMTFLLKIVRSADDNVEGHFPGISFGTQIYFSFPLLFLIVDSPAIVGEKDKEPKKGNERPPRRLPSERLTAAWGFGFCGKWFIVPEIEN